MTRFRLPCLALLACAAAAAQDAAPQRSWDPALGVCSLGGKLRYEGKLKSRPPLDASCDPCCDRAMKAGARLEPVLANEDGTLRLAFVHVSKGLEGWSFPLPETALVIAQNGCVFSPRIAGLRVGQKLRIRNDDPTTHNVQALPKYNEPFNVVQSDQGAEKEVVFTHAESMLRLKCNIHPWMCASLGVLPHPFFAVCDDKGRYEIAGLPEGEVTVSAWHELFGKLEQKVVLTKGSAASADFLFKAKGG